ncbi:MAG: hypothetical protein AAF992_23145 [Bacteroidota bacterium]
MSPKLSKPDLPQIGFFCALSGSALKVKSQGSPSRDGCKIVVLSTE